MAKGIRSKSKKKFRNIKRQQVDPEERKKLEVLASKLDEIRRTSAEDFTNVTDESSSVIAAQPMKIAKVKVFTELTEVESPGLKSNVSKTTKTKKKTPKRKN